MRAKKITKGWSFPTEFSQYSVGEVDYSTYNPCQHGSDCCENDYCRCGTITDTSIKNIDLAYVIEQITKGSDCEFFRYCVDRLARIYKIYDTNAWEVIVCGGYYGQEIEGVKLTNSEFIKAVEKCFGLPEQERIGFVLSEEYGFLLPELIGKTFQEVTANRNELRIGNQSYHKKIKPGLYAATDLPIGIYKRTTDGYVLIDGYHRFIDIVQNTEEERFKLISAE